MEHDEQTALFEWAALNEETHPELKMLFAVPNGGRRPRKTARMMKEEGQKPGVPDIFLAVARGGYHGLFIEMKTVYESGRRGSASQEQRGWLRELQKHGYAALVCWSWEDASSIISNYLTGEVIT